MAAAFVFFLLSLVTTSSLLFFFFFNDTATTEIYTLSLHDALPIFRRHRCAADQGRAQRHGVSLRSPRHAGGGGGDVGPAAGGAQGAPRRIRRRRTLPRRPRPGPGLPRAHRRSSDLLRLLRPHDDSRARILRREGRGAWRSPRQWKSPGESESRTADPAGRPDRALDAGRRRLRAPLGAGSGPERARRGGGVRLAIPRGLRSATRENQKPAGACPPRRPARDDAILSAHPSQTAANDCATLPPPLSGHRRPAGA